jgi:hypothetical protein
VSKITFAKLHSGLFIPNAGGPGKSLNTKDTMPPESTLLKNLEMTYLDSGAILLTWDSEGLRKRYIVGASNVASVMLEPEKIPPVKVVKSA